MGRVGIPSNSCATAGKASKAAIPPANSGNRLLSGLGSNRYDFYGWRSTNSPPTRSWESAPTTSSSVSQAAVAAKRPLAIPTASSCARSPRRACSVRCSRWSASARRCWRAGGRCAVRTILSGPRSRRPRSAGFAYWARSWLIRLVLRVRRSRRTRLRPARNGVCLGARRGDRSCGVGEGAPAAGSAPAMGRRGRYGVGGARKRGDLRARVGHPSGQHRALLFLGLLGLAAVVSLAAPWLSERQVQSAAGIWPKAPLVAYSHLDDAAKLNPLSDRAYLVEGSIALRFGDLARAEARLLAGTGARARRCLRYSGAWRDRL